MIYDFLIIGSGIAGLNAARLIPKDKKVLILCKLSPWECNTFYAQGGIAYAIDKNDIKTHIKDTLKAGVYFNNKKASKILSHSSKDSIDDLISIGVEFDKDDKNNLSHTKEAAHTTNRIIHANGDATGRMIHKSLLNSCHHSIITNSVVCDLLIDDGICYGAVYFDINNRQKTIYSHNTIIASGGVGSLYKYHTNSPTIAGEIHGICLQKGIRLKDMEMMQFHPTVLKGTSYARKTLLSEALRGEGAFIVDEDGYRFLFDYHKKGELAPRDIVSRAIFDHNQKTSKNIYLSFESFEKEFFKKRFPNIYSNIKELGYELPFEKVPISPAFHYAMGGIDVTLKARVKKMKNLYAIGEAACNRVHGANRLASNSLLEGAVFSKIAVKNALKNDFKINKKDYKKKIINYIRNKNIDKEIKRVLRDIMWNSVSIVRSKSDLKIKLKKIDILLKKDIGRLLFLRLLTAKSILKSALKRKKSLGAHYLRGTND